MLAIVGGNDPGPRRLGRRRDEARCVTKGSISTRRARSWRSPAMTATPCPGFLAQRRARCVTLGPAAGRRAAPTGEVKIGLAAEPNTFDPHLTVGRNSQIFIVNVFDGLTARDAQGNLVPGARGVVEATEPDHVAVRPAQGRQVPQRRRLQRRVRQVHARPRDQPRDEGHDHLRAQHDRAHRDRRSLHGQRGHQGARLPAAGAPRRAVRPDALAEAHERHGQGSDRDQAERDRPLQARLVGEERAARARGERELLARRAEGEDDRACGRSSRTPRASPPSRRARWT